MTDQTPSQDLVPRGQSETEAWLSRQTGVEVTDVEGRRVISIGRQLENVVNVLVPVSQVQQVNPHFVPNPRVVQLNPDTDAYKIKGKFALNKTGLGKLADLGQIEIVDQRVDYMGGAGVRVTTVARMRGPDGVWRHDVQSKAVRYDVLKRQVARQLREKGNPSEDDIDKRYDESLEVINEMASSKSWLRCVRNLLSVRAAYTAAELKKPFFLLGWNFSPNADDPNVQALMALQYREGSRELYGEEPQGMSPAALPAGELDALEAAEDEAEQSADKGAEVTLDPLPGERAQEPPAPPAAAEPAKPPAPKAAPQAAPQPVEQAADQGDPGPAEEAWNIDEDLSTDTHAIPKPEEHFTPTAGPYQGIDVEEIVDVDDGKFWLARVTMRLDDGPKRDVALRWLEYATSGDVTAETLEEFLESSPS